MGGENGGMVGQDRFYEFEAERLRQARKAKIFWSLALCQEADVIKYLSSQRKSAETYAKAVRTL